MKKNSKMLSLADRSNCDGETVTVVDPDLGPSVTRSLHSQQNMNQTTVMALAKVLEKWLAENGVQEQGIYWMKFFTMIEFRHVSLCDLFDELSPWQ